MGWQGCDGVGLLILLVRLLTVYEGGHGPRDCVVHEQSGWMDVLVFFFFFPFSLFFCNGIIRLRRWAEAGVGKGVAEKLPSPFPGLFFPSFLSSRIGNHSSSHVGNLLGGLGRVERESIVRQTASSWELAELGENREGWCNIAALRWFGCGLRVWWIW